MTDPTYIDLQPPGRADADILRDRSIDNLRQGIPGFETGPGDPLYHLADASAELAADNEAILRDQARARWRTFGRTMEGVAPLDAIAASATSTWTVTPAPSLRTIRAGTPVLIDGVLFETPVDVVVAASATTVTGVPLVAVKTGAAANGLSSPAALLEALGYVTSVVVTTASAGGQDAESDSAYDDRLAKRVRARGPLVTPANFALRALEHASVGGALGVDLYKPGAPYDTTAADANAAGHITVAVRGIDGLALNATIRGQIAASFLKADGDPDYITGLTPWVINATYTPIDVVATVELWPGYTPAVVIAAAQAAVAAYLAPATWGTPPIGEAPAWHDMPVVDRGSVEAAILAVDGVKRVVTLTLNGATSDITLAGPAALPQVGAAPAITAV